MEYVMMALLIGVFVSGFIDKSLPSKCLVALFALLVLSIPFHIFDKGGWQGIAILIVGGYFIYSVSKTKK